MQLFCHPSHWSFFSKLWQLFLEKCRDIPQNRDCFLKLVILSKIASFLCKKVTLCAFTDIFSCPEAYPRSILNIPNRFCNWRFLYRYLVHQQFFSNGLCNRRMMQLCFTNLHSSSTSCGLSFSSVVTADEMKLKFLESIDLAKMCERVIFPILREPIPLNASVNNIGYCG